MPHDSRLAAQHRLVKPFIVTEEEMAVFRRRLIRRLTDALTVHGQSHCLDVAWERRRVATIMADAVLMACPEDTDEPRTNAAGFRLPLE